MSAPFAAGRDLPIADVATGAVLGATFAGLIFLMWGMSTWYEPVLITLAGAGFYTLLGGLFHLQAKQKLKEQESASTARLRR